MFDSLLTSVISIDRDLETIHFYSMAGAGKKETAESAPSAEENAAKKNAVTHEMQTYRLKAFGDAFFSLLKTNVKIHSEKSGGGKVALILPDQLFFFDTAKVPTIQKKKQLNSVDVYVKNTYKSAKDLKYRAFPISHNKISSTFCIFGTRRDLLKKIISAVEEAGASVSETTFASAATLSGAIALNGKLKNTSYLLIDVKKKATYFVCVLAGKAVGFYSLPFGYSSFRNNTINFEPTLFDHLAADLLVLNAKEKAKKKQLTKVEDEEDEEEEGEAPAEGEPQPAAPEEEPDDEPEEEEPEEKAAPEISEAKVGALYRRLNKKLPKFLLRPEPDSAEGYVYENFRPILKWALELIRNNSDVIPAESIKTAYLNLPEKYSFLFDRIKEEGTPIPFLPVGAEKAGEEIAANLELYGGFYLKKFNKANNI